jgi:hypothetical protein
LFVFVIKIILTIIDFITTKDPVDTPWTNSSLVGAAGYLTYNGKGTVLTNSSLASFTSVMNSRTFPFSFDHAVAVME